MKLICTNIPKNELIQKSYNTFYKNCLDGNASVAQIRHEFHCVQKMYVKNGQVQDFFDKTSTLCDKVEQNGNKSLGTLLVNELSKLCEKFKIKGTPENVLYRAIANSRRNHDGLHELARIINLENIYKYSNNRKDIFKVLRMKKDCCKRILADYNTNAQNFLSIRKAPTTERQVKIQLAYTYSSLAEMLANRHPDDAIALFERAEKINRELGRSKAADYANFCIKDIKNGRFWNAR